MPRPPDTLPAGERCDGCAYALEGLPFKGRCPECNTPYAFTFLYRRTALGIERCGDNRTQDEAPGCGYPLKGLPLRGTCPECGQSYWFDRPRRKRPRQRVRDTLRHLLDRIGIPSTGVMGGLFILIILAALGLIVWKLLERINHVFIEPQNMS